MLSKIFSKFSKTETLVEKERQYLFYEQVSRDIQSGRKDEGVWAKAFSEAMGDEQKAKAIYIKLMAERLSLNYESIQESKISNLNSGTELGNPNHSDFGTPLGKDALTLETLQTILKKFIEDPDGGKFFVLTISEAENIYVQANCNVAGETTFELTSQHFLVHPDLMTSERIETLLSLGWNPPEDENSNFFRTLSDESLVNQLYTEQISGFLLDSIRVFGLTDEKISPFYSSNSNN